MAFLIKVREGDVRAIHQAIYEFIEQSRFSCRVSTLHSLNKRYVGIVKLEVIRLRKRKPYCGNHSGPCLLTGDANPDVSRRFLEGADWVELNWSVCRILDAHNASADVATSAVVIRKERESRIYYGGASAYPRSLGQKRRLQ